VFKQHCVGIITIQHKGEKHIDDVCGSDERFNLKTREALGPYACDFIQQSHLAYHRMDT